MCHTNVKHHPTEGEERGSALMIGMDNRVGVAEVAREGETGWHAGAIWCETDGMSLGG